MIKGYHLSDKKTRAKMVKSWINRNSHMKPIKKNFATVYRNK